MLVWKKDKEYSFSKSQKEREKQFLEMADPSLSKRISNLNNALNIAVATGAFVLSGGNLLVTGLSFVGLDFVLNFADNFFLNYIPYKKNIKMSIIKRQKLLDNIKNKKDYWVKELEKFEKNHCEDCRWEYSGCTKCAYHKKCLKNKRYYTSIYNEQKEIVDAELKEIKQAEIESNTKRSSDYKDKLEFLISAKDRIEFFDDKFVSVSLKKISQSLGELIIVLNDKPQGFQMLRGSLMTYLDELLNILEMWQSLDNVKKESYKADIEKISKVLGESVAGLTERISNMEVQDIEVSISVLLNELSVQSENEIEVN